MERKNHKIINIIGAGLAGSEAAYQLAKRGYKVNLYEQKRHHKHEAFKTSYYSELICSNSFRNNDLYSAAGLLKEEMRMLDSLIMKSALLNSVAGGKSLAVDRLAFSKYITDVIDNHENINVIHEEVNDINIDKPTIIAAGPLCSDNLAKSLQELCGNDFLYFYDAISPIVLKDSIDFNKAYYKSRYLDDEIGDYINCPMTKEEYDIFYNELINAKKTNVKEMDSEIFFEGCMPFEEMAKRGYKTLLFGPMKPKGLRYKDINPYAVVQLRKDNAIDTLYNVVGFQTHLTFDEQKRILRLIPGLENVDIVRYGVMHRNTYLNSPKIINNKYQMISYPNIFVAGQISGVEGYIESAASGLYSALMMINYLNNIDITLSAKTMIGAMINYISDKNINKLVPMNANFGIIKTDFNGHKNDKKQYIVSKALEEIKIFKEKINA